MDNIDWKFWVGAVLIPLLIFILGLFLAKSADKFSKISSKSKIKGDNNTVIQNSKVEEKTGGDV